MSNDATTNLQESSLEGHTILMSGGSRGIGLAIALRAARDGANIAILAKTAEPHPTLEGTVHTAAAQIEEAGGRALAIAGDVRNDADIQRAVALTAETFGGIDKVINNASAINLINTESIDMKRYDLMQDINARGTFALSKFALEHLKGGRNPHILTLSPPLNLDPKWFKDNLAYTMAKYGMSMVTLGLAAELAEAGIAVNSLWPRTLIDTAAVRNMPGGAELVKRARTPEIMADAAYAILTSPSSLTGNFLIDDDVLTSRGVTDLEKYSPGVKQADLLPDFYL